MQVVFSPYDNLLTVLLLDFAYQGHPSKVLWPDAVTELEVRTKLWLKGYIVIYFYKLSTTNIE